MNNIQGNHINLSLPNSLPWIYGAVKTVLCHRVFLAAVPEPVQKDCGMCGWEVPLADGTAPDDITADDIVVPTPPY